jgi:hypothetical protein
MEVNAFPFIRSRLSFLRVAIAAVVLLISRHEATKVTLDPSNYPIGVKDIITGGDLPVVWANTKYRMVCMNMGHGDKIFTDATHNLLISQAFLWVGNSK